MSSKGRIVEHMENKIETVGLSNDKIIEHNMRTAYALNSLRPCPSGRVKNWFGVCVPPPPACSNGQVRNWLGICVRK
jgi:hypothetical protein